MRNLYPLQPHSTRTYREAEYLTCRTREQSDVIANPEQEGLRRATEPKGYEELLSQLDPLLATWYRERFTALSPPQALAVPCIMNGQNTLVSSPTGTGKTLTGFLAVLDNLFKLARDGELEDRVYCVYVSPLKALANDIDRNLREPLAEISRMAKKTGEKPPRIRVGLRSGDTPQSKRAAMTRKPPHILITTPESLSLVLAAPRFSQHLRGVSHLILDELHDLATSKRGTLLTLSLEQLCHWLEVPPVRIGLSATLAPLETLAHFLAGYSNDRPRPCTIVETAQWKKLDLKVICPVSDGTRTPASLAFEKEMQLLVKLIQEHETTLVFTNTRAATERVLLKLEELGVEAVAAHHGSMSKEVRLRVEQQLKEQKLKAVVSSTSLELGLDIGDLDLVIQLGSPRSIAKGLQRVGRAGHALQAVAKGRFVAFEPDDILECSALVREALNGALDRVEPPELGLDVLAQALVGFSLHGEWKVDELWELVRGAWPYRNLELDVLDEIIDYLSSMELSEQGVYPKVGYNPEIRTIFPRRSSRLLYYLNVGTIPSQSNYTVILEATGQPLGNLEESFVERLRTGDIFVLGGRLYAFQGLKGSTVLVRDGQSHRPTIPSWGGEVAARSRELSVAVSDQRQRLTRELEETLATTDNDEQEKVGQLLDFWSEQYHLDPAATNTLFNHLHDQLALAGVVPTQDHLLVEGYLDPEGEPEVLVHSPYGRRINEAWSRAIAGKLARQRGWVVGLTVAEEGFIMSLPVKMDLKELVGLVNPVELEALLREALRDSEPLKLRFRNTASRALAVLRNYRVHEVSLRRQRQRTQDLLGKLRDTDHPLMREALKEVEHELWEVEEAMALLGRLATNEVKVSFQDYSTKISPMGLPILLAGLMGTTTLEERWNLQRELHTEILAHLIPADMIGKSRFDSDDIRTFFDKRRQARPTPEGLLGLLGWQGALDLLGSNEGHEGSLAGLVLNDEDGATGTSGTDEDRFKKMARELIRSGKVVPVWNGSEQPCWAPVEQAGNYYSLYGRPGPLSKTLKAALQRLGKGERVKARHLVRGLRRAFVAGHDANGKLVPTRQPEAGTREEALEWAVILKLRSLGPLNCEKLALELRLEEAEVTAALDQLASRGVVTRGYFITDNGPTQYLWTEDCVFLELMLEGESTVVEADRWLTFAWGRSMAPHRDWQTALERMGGVSHPLTVWQRSAGLKLRDWSNSMMAGEILQGRFRGGQIHNLPAELVPLFVGCFRTKATWGNLDKEVIELLRDHPQGLTRRELTSFLTLRHSREAITETIRRLEANLRLHRRPLAGSGGTRPLQNYLALPEMPEVDEPNETLIELMLDGHGPATRHQLWQLTGLDGDVLTTALAGLECQGQVERMACAGLQPQYIFLLARDRDPMLGHTGPGPMVTLLHRTDPFILGLRREIQARFGDSWTLALMDGGRPVGVVDIDPRPGVVEITEVKLQQDRLWPALLNELRRLSAFYRQTAGEVILWRTGAGGPLGQASEGVLDHFSSAGYQSRWDIQAQGDLLDETYPFGKLLAYMLACQHIHPAHRFASGQAAIRGLGEIRDLFELSVRVKGPFNSPADYAPELGLVVGPGAYGAQSYLNIERARLLQKVRGVKLTPDMAEVLSLLPDGASLTKDMLAKRTRLERVQFNQAIRGLTQGLRLVKDPWGGFTRLEPGRAMETEEAIRTLVLRAIEEAGIVSFEGLTRLLARYCDGPNLLEALSGLEEGGMIEKGFLDQEEVTLYYILAGKASKLGKVPNFKGAYILSPTDRLAQVLTSRIKQEYGLSGTHILFEGTAIMAAFKLRRSGKRIRVIAYEGNQTKRYVVDEWARQFHLDHSWELEG